MCQATRKLSHGTKKINFEGVKCKVWQKESVKWWGGNFTNKTVKLYRINGIFCNAHEQDAWILAHIFGFKVINGRVGFPNTKLEKVRQELEDMKINYAIIYPDGEAIEKNYGKRNSYDFHLKDARNYMDFVDSIDYINRKLKNSSLDDIKKIVELIHEYYEQ